MKTLTLIAFVLFLVGCGGAARPFVPQQAAGPSAQDQEVAFEIVWEGVLGLSVEQRPHITWWVGCPEGHENTGCYDEYSTPGNDNLIWIGENPVSGQTLAGVKISDTHFSSWLEGQWEWIKYPNTFSPGNLSDVLTKQAQDQLIMAGL